MEVYGDIEYYFYDTDAMGVEDYDIRDEEYKRLIHACCHFSDYFSLAIWNEESRVVALLKKYEIKEKKAIHPRYQFWNEKKQCWSPYVNCFYSVCEETRDILLQSVQGIFDWYKWSDGPGGEDLCFYRKDGTLFFSSVIHDGELILSPLENEQLFEWISGDNWTEERWVTNYGDLPAE